MNLISVDNLQRPDLVLFSQRSESMLLHHGEPGPGLFLVETALVVDRALDAGCRPVSLLVDRHRLMTDPAFYATAERCGNIPVYSAEESVLREITGFPLTRGMLCLMERRPLPTVEEVIRGVRRVAILEDVMNPTNVGAVFRSAAALGIDAVLLSPASADPLYRRAIRVSMATVFLLPWTYTDQHGRKGPSEGTENTVRFLRTQGFRTVAMALSDDSVSIDEPSLSASERLAIVLGTEGTGLREETIAACDATARIPMSRGVDSLNVAAASAIAFFQLCR